MATTTNFGWETPDDTDLVKDGAAAIRTSLNGVDTSFVDLKGGTTGQVLSKASGTDLDYSWVNAPAGKIPQTLQVFKVDAFSTSTASWVDVTGLSVSITPSATSSKILVMVKVTGSNASLDSSIRLMRGATVIADSTAGSSYNGFGKMNGYNYSAFLMGTDYLDSPSSTSSVTYKVQVFNTGGTTYINRAPIDATFGTVSSITVMEITA